ncbi:MULTISPECIES: M15 family metallopeptidase [unclassified Roseofilum]|uniref:M15 family metallopeptidase n=1 Tax=unclassified Roseofilum TaxID=2620099 RepID=UPI00298E0802|nr:MULTISPECIES: M15 family metallopeptidase [unclassified Roseofilum]
MMANVYKWLTIFLVVIGIMVNIYALSNSSYEQDTNKLSNESTTLPSTQDIEPLEQLIDTTNTDDTGISYDTNKDTETKEFTYTENGEKEFNESISVRKQSSESKFGHLSYTEIESANLIVVGSYGQHQYQRFEKLMPEAALALMKMIYTARDDGVWIIAASGFRSYKIQEELFNRKVQIQGSDREAAKSVAPPGYSEHRTGYAVDLVDGHSPNADINSNFATTAAFQWLVQHAQDFGYELSFPENNPQQVKYEPWHWRFIGSPKAQKLFKNHSGT